MISIHKILAVVAITTIVSCKSKTTNQLNITVTKNNDCKPYFHFDKIEHYFLDIKEQDLWATEEKKNKSDKERKELEFLLQYTPDKLADTVVLKGIEKLDFVKKEVPSKMFGEINEIFCEQKNKELISKTCIAIFRDILVFKKDNKIVGVAKICFSCNQTIITGTNLNTEDFNKAGNYERLNKILRSQ